MFVYRSSVHRRVVEQIVLLYHCHSIFAWEKSPRHVRSLTTSSPTSESLLDLRNPARAAGSTAGPNAPRLPRGVLASPPIPAASWAWASEVECNKTAQYLPKYTLERPRLQDITPPTVLNYCLARSIVRPQHLDLPGHRAAPPLPHLLRTAQPRRRNPTLRQAGACPVKRKRTCSIQLA